jgi:hypothetical protein
VKISKDIFLGRTPRWWKRYERIRCARLRHDFELPLPSWDGTTSSAKSQKLFRREGHFQLFSTLSIGHKELPGFQRVISRPFPAKRYRGSNRQDLVFVRPPDAGKDFRVSINTVCYEVSACSDQDHAYSHV